MTSGATQLRRYPVVAVTLGVGLVGLLLEFVGPDDPARWVVSAYALVIVIVIAIVIAAVEAWSMAKKLLKGHAGLDVLAVAAVLATVAVAEYWASLVIVLMLLGGVRRSTSTRATAPCSIAHPSPRTASSAAMRSPTCRSTRSG